MVLAAEDVLQTVEFAQTFIGGLRLPMAGCGTSMVIFASMLEGNVDGRHGRYISGCGVNAGEGMIGLQGM